MGSHSIHRQLTRAAISLGAGNLMVRSLLRLACRKYGTRCTFFDNKIEVCRDKRIIRIAASNFPYAIDMARSFELYFSQVSPSCVGDSLVADYSYPHVQHYLKLDLDFEITSFPEEAEAIGEYFRQYRPKPGEIVFDLGAYCGVSAYFLSQRVGALGRVYAFEPDQTNFLLLQRNIERHELNNVTPLRIAIAGSSGVAQFCSEGTMGSCLSQQMSRATVGEVVEVRTLSLQDACARYGIPSFVKMDVEGAELEVLSGARAFLKDHPIHFVLDTNHRVNGVLTNKAVEELFAECGYWSESSNECGSMTTWAEKRDSQAGDRP